MQTEACPALELIWLSKLFSYPCVTDNCKITFLLSKTCFIYSEVLLCTLYFGFCICMYCTSMSNYYFDMRVIHIYNVYLLMESQKLPLISQLTFSSWLQFKCSISLHLVVLLDTVVISRRGCTWRGSVVTKYTSCIHPTRGRVCGRRILIGWRLIWRRRWYWILIGHRWVE